MNNRAGTRGNRASLVFPAAGERPLPFPDKNRPESAALSGHFPILLSLRVLFLQRCDDVRHGVLRAGAHRREAPAKEQGIAV